MTHDPKKCERTREPTRYSFRNHSAQFACPECSRTCWKSLNFLGQNAIFCNGRKFKTVKKFSDLTGFIAESIA